MDYKQITPAEFPFLHYVIYESMRFNPSLINSEAFQISRNCKLGKYNFKEGAQVTYNIFGVHNNPKEWQQPEKFLPERFDPESPLFKTTDGKMRHPLSFIPFSFGDRKCAAYKLAEYLSPNVLIRLIHNFDFEFADSDLQNEPHMYPIASIFQNHLTPIMIRCTKINEFKE